MQAPDAFVEPEIINHRLHIINALSENEDSLTAQRDDLDAVLEIVDTPAWTDEDFLDDDDDLQDDHIQTYNDRGERVRHSRLDRLCLELDRHRFVDQNTQDLGHGSLADSPFWFCAQEAKADAIWCLVVHQGRWRQPLPPGQIWPTNTIWPPLVVRANTDSYMFGCPEGKHVPGGDGQVFVAFSLATLLYASFEIPIPERGATPLWQALLVYGQDRNRTTVPAFQCLDLASPVYPGLPNDRHGLKPNLVDNAFVINGLGHTEGYNRTKYFWPEQPVKPWRAVLRELAGYVKHAQARLPAQPALNPLDEVRRLCTAAKEDLQQKIKDRAHARVAATLSLVKDAVDNKDEKEQVVDNTDHKKQLPDQKQLRLLRVRMQALLNIQ